MARWQNGKMAKKEHINLYFNDLRFINRFATVWQNVFFRCC